MRYHLIPLALVSLLAACGDVATGPTTNLDVDAGGGIPQVDPNIDPGLCRKRSVWVSSLNQKRGLEATRIPSGCGLDEPALKKRQSLR
jgi:hypothetical protein